MISMTIMAGAVAGYSPFIMKRMLRFDGSALAVLATYLVCVIAGGTMIVDGGLVSGGLETAFMASAVATFFLTIIFRIT